MELTKAVRLVEACYTDSRLHELYAKGDRLSSAQTKHDISHANQVRDVAIDLTAQVHSRMPELLDDWTRLVIIPLGAFLHDIGRSIDVDTHDIAGARWANEFLRTLTLPGDSETLPDGVIKHVCRIIACHRASRYLKKTFQDAALDIVVIADKCVGDEDRVRPWRAAVLRVLTFFGLAWVPLRKGGIHDRINFAIKNARLDIDGGELVLKLLVDTRVCAYHHIHELYEDRFWACGRAAKSLGYKFRLEFNGERHAWVDSDRTWRPTKFIQLGR